MSENLEAQAEELEALASIYDGDTNFKQVNATTFQYKVREKIQSVKMIIEKSFIIFQVW
jgi:hypothetical protein